MLRAVKSGFSSIQYVGRALGGNNLVLNLLSVVVVSIALGWPHTTVARIAVGVGVLIGVVTISYVQVIERRNNPVRQLMMGLNPLPRIVLASAALAVAEADEHRWWVVVTAAILMALIVGEAAVRRPIKGANPQAANIKGGNIPVPTRSLTDWYFITTTVAMAIFGIAAAFHVTQIPTVIATAVAFGFAGAVGVQSGRYLVGLRRYERELPAILDANGPVFAFHWQAPAGTAYQAAMWLPYLERIGKPYFILVRTIENFTEVVKMTNAPVILRVGLEDLDPVVRPTLKAVFYVNTAVRNSHMIRFPQMTHIQLNHGDSDKVASVSPTFRQYDRNFVAGQAAIDRFAKHGVATLPEQFEIVGRPQLEDVQRATGPVSEIENPTVLYSPTWSGFYEDSDYSSLSAGPEIVKELLARGCTVVFRPHPYSRRHKANTQACDEIIEMLSADTSRPHVFGPVAESEMSVVDCFNACDAMISDVSSVVSDFLISGKPFAMAAVSAQGQAFIDEFPLAQAAYVFDAPRRKRKTTGLSEQLDQMLGADPLADKRAAVRNYYLSDTPPEHIAERFLDTARSYL